ncbi:MAG: hypothetical protein R2849_06235 [Thermomicrobiales bacterium]
MRSPSITGASMPTARQAFLPGPEGDDDADDGLSGVQALENRTDLALAGWGYDIAKIDRLERGIRVAEPAHPLRSGLDDLTRAIDAQGRAPDWSNSSVPESESLSVSTA